MILGSTQSYDDSVWLGYSEITLCTCWCPLHMHAKLCVFAVMVVRVGEIIYRKIFPSVAAKHTYEWLESIPRPARHCLSSRKILQDCMVTIPVVRVPQSRGPAAGDNGVGARDEAVVQVHVCQPCRGRCPTL